jgi:predicted dehydrogenase
MSHPRYRIGVMGCGGIARQFVPAVNARHAALASRPGARHSMQVVACASRDLPKAQAFAAEFKLPRAHGSYEVLLADPGIDVVYIPLPNSMHCEWVIKAAAAGKHVLCEKPLAMGRAEAVQMFDAAQRHGVMLLEAYPYWFQPQTRDMMQLIHSGAIGQVRHVQATFGFNLKNGAGNIRMNPSLGGGALMDAGSYAMALIRQAIPEAPQQVQAHGQWSGGQPGQGVDMGTTATLLYSGGRSAQLHCAMNVGYHRLATILGNDGVIETEFLNHTAPAPGHPLNDLPSLMRVRQGFANSTPFADVRSATGSGFAFCVEAFAQVIRSKDQAAIAATNAASIDIAATLEAISQSLRSGGSWVSV